MTIASSSFTQRMISALELELQRVNRALIILKQLPAADQLTPQKKRELRGFGRAWTPGEHRLLGRLYKRKSWPELERIFRRTAKAISSRAKLLGIKRGNRKRWTAAEDRQLKQLYPTGNSKKLAARFGCTLYQLYNRAHRLGLNKDERYIAEMNAELGRQLTINGKANRYPKGHVPANKGLRRPGWTAGRMRETQFKKGQRSGAAQAKWVPVGTVQLSADGYLRRKIADLPEAIAGKGAHSTNWEFVHRRVWEDAHGPIPAGYRIWWKDGNHLNCALENLELLSGKEHMARTTIHNLPPELKEVILLKGAIKRHITHRRKHAREEQDHRPARPPVRDPGSLEGRGETYGYRAS